MPTFIRGMGRRQLRPMEQAYDKALAQLLAQVITAEGSVLGPEGMRTTGEVAMNRIGDPWYGQDLKSVLTQPKAFAAPYMGKLSPEALEIAADLLLDRGKRLLPKDVKAFHSFKESTIPKGWGDTSAYELYKTLEGKGKKSRLHFFKVKKTKEFDPEGSDYDYQAAIASGGRANVEGHWGSLDPRTGMVLKGRKHPTWGLMIEEERKLGNEVIKIGNRYYSRPKKGGE